MPGIQKVIFCSEAFSLAESSLPFLCRALGESIVSFLPPLRPLALCPFPSYLYSMKTLSALLLCLLGYCSAVLAQDAVPSFTLNGHHLSLPVPVTFKTGSAELTPESLPALEHVKAYLEAKSFITMMRIEVHTDAAGDERKNQTLSEQRALSVGRWLVEHGIDCKRLLCTGFGSNKPVQANDTPEGRAANRRVEFVNAMLKGRHIGGMPADGGGKVAGDLCR